MSNETHVIIAPWLMFSLSAFSLLDLPEDLRVRFAPPRAVLPVFDKTRGRAVALAFFSGFDGSGSAADSGNGLTSTIDGCERL